MKQHEPTDPCLVRLLRSATVVAHSQLGFHIIQLTDAKAAHQMTFDQSRMETSLMLANQKRATAVEELVAKLSPQAEFIRGPLQ